MPPSKPGVWTRHPRDLFYQSSVVVPELVPILELGDSSLISAVSDFSDRATLKVSQR